MNRKGFTLIELVTVIIILAILTVIIYPMVAEKIKQAQENNYYTLKENAKAAAEMFYNGCSSGIINGGNDCTTVLDDLSAAVTGTSTLSTTVTARILLKYGLLKPTNIPKKNETVSVYEIFDPRNDKNKISDCLKVKITKGANYKYTYEVNDDSCPNPYE